MSFWTDYFWSLLHHFHIPSGYPCADTKQNNSVEAKKQTLEKHYITLHIALLDSFIGINTSPVLYTPR